MTLAPSRILLVEDNPDDLELAQMAFKQGKFANQIDVALDAFSALEALFLSSYSHCRQEQVSISLPSLRVGSVSEDLMRLMTGSAPAAAAS